MSWEVFKSLAPLWGSFLLAWILVKILNFVIKWRKAQRRL